jgi:uncharacterized protein (DUF58 family)
MTMDAPDTVVRRLRPTGYLPFIAWGWLLFMQLISPASAWSWMLVGLGVLLIVSYLWARMLRDQVSVSREVLGTWVVAGDRLREQFTLTNAGRLPVLWAQVADHSAVPGYRAGRVESASSAWARGTCAWPTPSASSR